MTVRNRLYLIGLAICLSFGPVAAADKRAEAYVETQANNVFEVLNDKSLNSEARSKKFSEYLHAFSYLPDIARRVLGAQGRTISPAVFDRYFVSFEQYAIAVYEVRFDELRGGSLKVTGSSDPAPRRSLVTTVIKSAESGKESKVVWDVLQSQDGASFRVRDVGINLDGSLIWLAQDQQAQFETFLDRNNGDIDLLIARIKQKTATIDERRKSRTPLPSTRADRTLD